MQGPEISCDSKLCAFCRVYYNNMAAGIILYLVFGMTAITTESLQSDIRNTVRSDETEYNHVK